MKVILTGASGFIGGEILQQCLRNPSITSLVVLSRRQIELPPQNVDGAKQSKVVLLEDFESYSPTVLSELSGAEACLWALGSTTREPVAGRKINLDYTMAGANAFATSLATQLETQGGKFRFVYTSGMVTSKDQNKKLWISQEFRRIRGDVENKLLSLPEELGRKNFEPIIVRPGGVLAKGKGFVTSLLPNWTISVEQLAASMIDLAIKGRDSEKDTWECGELVKRGNEILARGL